TTDKIWGDKQRKVYILDDNGEKIYDPIKRQYKCGKEQTTDWNEQHKAEEWRESWADIQNQHLEKHGFDIRVDHRSFERQGIEQIPTIHLGVAAHQMEQRGIPTERGDINRAIKFANQKLRNLKTQIVELKNDISALLVMERESQADRQTLPQKILTPKPIAPPQPTAQQAPPTPPPPKPTELNILEMLKNMLSDPMAKAKVQRITSLSVVKSAVEFLEQYNITTLSKLQKTVANTEAKFDKVNEETKAIEDRLKKLNPLIKQADLYLQHREINNLYKQQKPKHKDRFYETHRTELTLYEAAERFLKANLDGKTLNTKAWKKEAAELTAEKDKLYHEYKGLKEGVRQIGVVRRSVEHILDNAEKMEQPQQQRRHEMER
ncbi:MAG: MobA/MobL family protein, partial [Firmicutes bacterium]|nr:MobA/MobL family protein [Bacillota bacterium]